jgi:micrococcal nuclease
MLGACGEEPSAPPQAALVVRIVDGDTLVLAGGIKVRVLGIDAPEMERDGHPADFLAHKAKAVLADLTLNKTIALEYDRLRYDRYGRLLAYLRLPDHTLVNAELVRQGLARVYFIAPNLRYQKELLTAQQEAIEAQRGIWQQLLKQDEAFYLGNRHTLRLHRPQCPLAAKMAKANQVRFTSLKEAYLQGYSPCRSCKP